MSAAVDMRPVSPNRLHTQHSNTPPTPIETGRQTASAKKLTPISTPDEATVAALWGQPMNAGTRDSCDVCGRTTPEMHYVAVARKLLCSRCWREPSRQSANIPAGQLALSCVEPAQLGGPSRG
jgi:hypothetical protein